jgi:acetate kinase
VDVDDVIVLCLNSGSSSLKFTGFDTSNGGERELLRGTIDTGRNSDEAPLDEAFAQLEQRRLPAIAAVGHRIVHGGPHYAAPVLVDADVLGNLRAVVPLAPLHMPAGIAGIEAVQRRFPSLPQVACFDTAFHATMPEVAQRLPLPDRFSEAGIRRYGFHGLSYEYVMSVLGDARPARIVIAHLGNGASLVAVRDGRSIDTTMGLTPTGGVMMGTRTGDMDPGVLVYASRREQMSADVLEDLVNRRSGLTAVGGASDMRQLLERAKLEPRAKLAVDMFAYSVRKAIGSFTAALGGIELLVFTGGIGEHSPAVRSEICRGLDPFGIELDSEANSRGSDVISARSARCAVRVIATDEDLVIARHTTTTVGAASALR